MLGIFALTSLAVAISVTTVGVIGFIGLVIPHFVRLLVGSDHRIVLPASALAGGSLLVIADTLARTVIAPRQLPVGATPIEVDAMPIRTGEVLILIGDLPMGIGEAPISIAAPLM